MVLQQDENTQEVKPTDECVDHTLNQATIHHGGSASWDPSLHLLFTFFVSFGKPPTVVKVSSVGVTLKEIVKSATSLGKAIRKGILKGDIILVADGLRNGGLVQKDQVVGLDTVLIGNTSLQLCHTIKVFSEKSTRNLIIGHKQPLSSHSDLASLLADPNVVVHIGKAYGKVALKNMVVKANLVLTVTEAGFTQKQYLKNTKNFIVIFLIADIALLGAVITKFIGHINTTTSAALCCIIIFIVIGKDQCCHAPV